MIKRDLIQQIGRLPDETEITIGGKDFDVVKITRRGVTKIELDTDMLPSLPFNDALPPLPPTEELVKAPVSEAVEAEVEELEEVNEN